MLIDVVFVLFAMLSASQRHMIRNDVDSSRSTSFFNFPPGTQSLRPAIVASPLASIRTIFVFDEQQDIPNAVLFSHSCSIGTSSNCLSHHNRASGCPYNFRSRGTTGGLRCLTKIWATCVAEDVSTCLDILTLEFSSEKKQATLERVPFRPGCVLKRRRLVQRILSILNNIHHCCRSYFRG